MPPPAKANRVRILQQYVITHTSPAESPCISSGSFSERAGRTAQRAARGFSEKANLELGFIYLGYRFGIGSKTIEPALAAQLCAVGLTTHCIHKKPAAQGTHPAAGFSMILLHSQQCRHFPLHLFSRFLSVRSRFVLFPAKHTAPPARYESRPAAVDVPAACPPALPLVPVAPDARTG